MQTPEVTQQPDEFKIETRSLVLRLVAPLSVLPWVVHPNEGRWGTKRREQQQGWVSPVDTEVFAWGLSVYPRNDRGS